MKQATQSTAQGWHTESILYIGTLSAVLSLGREGNLCEVFSPLALALSSGFSDDLC